ncbi:hypothetical protein K505DRAFT_323675 [Melanomma pulvis-pyrius CBS 109.77]|uniref:Osmotin, thaumatin-like protein n=1 Tax=Melanomma pulvis-pyrius CBS 109.77 TaxID=1314802 RepID=A0A6A6XID3_9PLEO|nr:hypothetical protein K505DRAFT_323675 [Melanomma pulvis-pyrius CBS 109.77]
MLPKFLLLAGALQAALATAHVEKADGKGVLVDLNSPGYSHKHLMPIKPQDKMNMTDPGHQHKSGHHHRPQNKMNMTDPGHEHKSGHHHKPNHSHKHHHGNGMKGKLHGGPEKFNQTGNQAPGKPSKGYHSLEARQVGGNAILANRCYYDVWVWSVEEGYSSQAIYVPARTIYSEPKRAPANGGVVLKVSRTDQLVGGQQTQFEYATSNNVIYYDISFVDCAVGESAANCPGWDNGLNIGSPEPACQVVNCPSNNYCPTQAYFVDTPLQKLNIAEPVFGCGTAGTGMDIYFHTCSDTPQLTKRELSKKSVAGRIPVE